MMKNRIVIVMGDQKNDTMMVHCRSDKKYTYVYETLKIEAPISMRDLGRIVDAIPHLSKKKIPVTLVLPNKYESTLYEAPENLRMHEVPKWVNNYIRGHEQLALDAKNYEKVVEYDVFGKVDGKYFGSIVSCDTALLDDTYHAFKGYDLQILHAMGVYSFLSIESKDIQCGAVLELKEEKYHLHIYREGILAGSFYGNYIGRDIIGALEDKLLLSRASIEELLKEDGFINAIDTETLNISEEQKQFAGAIKTLFLDDTQKIIKQLDIAHSEQLAPTEIKVTGWFSNINGTDKWLEHNLKGVLCKTIIIPPSSEYGGIANAMAEDLKPEFLPAATIARGIAFEK